MTIKMNQKRYVAIRDLLLEAEEDGDTALLKKVNRLAFGLMLTTQSESTDTNTPNNAERKRMDKAPQGLA